MSKPISKEMSNQEVFHEIEWSLPLMPIGLREAILDSVWDKLLDVREEPNGAA